MNQPKVSVIVPTYNSNATIEACLLSIQKQSYENIELIVVDNNSKDNTKALAKKFTKHVFNKGPERSAQRNYGVERSSGDYVAIIDSDMELSENVVADCVKKMNHNEVVAVIIPEESFGKGFWAQCKKLERSFYVGVPWMEAARFFKKDCYLKLGGYNTDMVSGEDWDLSQRFETLGKIDRINSYIFHNEGELKLLTTLKKKYYYAKKFSSYQNTTTHTNSKLQTGPIARYELFFSQPKKLFKNPVIGLGMLFMKTSEFAFGLLGLMTFKHQTRDGNR